MAAARGSSDQLLSDQWLYATTPPTPTAASNRSLQNMASPLHFDAHSAPIVDAAPKYEEPTGIVRSGAPSSAIGMPRSTPNSQLPSPNSQEDSPTESTEILGHQRTQRTLVLLSTDG